MVLATASVVVLLLVAVYGPMIAPHDLSFVAALRDGHAPPFGPRPDLPLGTDDLGRDLWSWVLIGARVTLGIAASAAVLRVVLGSALGAVAGRAGGIVDAVLARAALGFSSIPATVLAVLGVIAFDVYAGPPAVALALGVVGWAEPFHFARRQTRLESSQLYVEAARALGMRERRLVLRHLFPNVAPTLIVLFALQVSAVLLLLGELGLLQIFIGGPLTEYTPIGTPVTVPSTPDWSSMLASTRPIRIVGGGSVWPLLAPALALIFSVGAVNLFGDALARRAQRLDVFRLATGRQVLAIAAVVAVLLTPAAMWPSPLAPELAYADPVRVGAADGPGGEEVAYSDDVPSPAVSLSGAGGELRGGADLEVYSLDDAVVTGPLVAASPATLTRPDPAAIGAIIALPGFAQANADGAATAARRVGARAVIFVTSSSLPFPLSSGGYAVPVLRASRSALERAAGAPLPPGFDSFARLTPVAASVTISVTVRHTRVTGTVHVGRLPAAGAEASGIVVVAGGADAATGATLGAIAEHARSRPLPVAIVTIADAALDARGAALVAGLATLTREERARVKAVLFVSGAGRPTVAPDPPDRSQPMATTASGRIARKVADALGARVDPQPTRALQLAARAAGVAAPTFVLEGSSDATGTGAVRDMARSALVLVAYVARPAPELP